MNKHNAEMLFTICLNALINLVLPNRISYFEPSKLKQGKKREALTIIAKGLEMYEQAMFEEGFSEKDTDEIDTNTFAHLDLMGRLNEIFSTLSVNQKDKMCTYINRKLTQMKQEKVK